MTEKFDENENMNVIHNNLSKINSKMNYFKRFIFN